MAIPKFHLFHKPILEAVADGQQYNNKEVRNFVSRAMNLSEDDLKALLPSRRQTTFYNRYSWAKTYLIRAGLLESVSRSIVAITPDGKKVLEENPDVIDTNYLSRYEGFRSFQGNTEEGEPEERGEADNTPEEILEQAFAKINNSLADEILSEIAKQTPEFFEQFIVDLLIKMGYGGSLDDAGTVTRFTGDGGIDGVIREDKLGFSQILIQAKRWSSDNPVTSPEIQKFVGALVQNGATKGLFVTTGRFTDNARESVKNNPGPKVVLVDGKQLAKLMIEHNFGVSIINTYEVKQIDTNFFVDSAT